MNSLCLTDKYLISGSDDKTAVVCAEFCPTLTKCVTNNMQVWDMEERKVVAVLKGHRLGVQSVVTDGKYIYTASDDCSIKVELLFSDLIQIYLFFSLRFGSGSDQFF